MGLLDWLFGNSETDRRPTQWQLSDNGNPTKTIGDIRITVFPQDGGWKYCIADETDRVEPYFSDAYESAQEAKEEAVRKISGEPSVYRSLKEQSWERSFQRRHDGLMVSINGRDEDIAAISSLLSQKDVSLDKLRRSETNIKSRLKRLECEMTDYTMFNVDENSMDQAKRQEIALLELARRVEALIAEEKLRRKSRSNK